MIRKLLLAILFSAMALPAGADEGLILEGTFKQGGVVFGQTDPDAVVQFAGRRLRLTEEGRFVFGFGRDFAEQAEIEIEYPDGRREQRTFAIEPREYAIQRIDGLPPKKVTPPEEVWERIQRENAEIAKARAHDRPLNDFLGPYQWPAQGIISGVYGSQRILNGEPRRPHYGIDIAAPQGARVVAPAGGVVALVAADHYYTGGTIIIDHGHGLSSAFLHMDEISVEAGQTVARGEPIGTVGATGRATGPHLDWRINWFKERLDPAFFVPPMPPLPEGG